MPWTDLLASILPALLYGSASVHEGSIVICRGGNAGNAEVIACPVCPKEPITQIRSAL